jgi:hypothetical protein
MPHDKNQIYPEYIIYKLCCDECDDFYIGSTRNMTERRRCHKSRCHNENDTAYNQKKYRTIRDNGGFENWRLVPIEKMENVSRFQAECREEIVRVELNALMNSMKATRGDITEQEYNKIYMKEYYKQNREQMKQNSKIYKENNREEVYRKQNEKFDCDCGGRFTQQNKIQHLKTNLHKQYLEQIE